MNRTWTVFKYELINTISRRSFILTLILVPLVPALILGVINILGDHQTQAIQELFIPDTKISNNEGYVDQADLIQSLPEWLPKDRLAPYPDEDSARLAMDEGKITAFYIIPENYIETGDVRYIRTDFNPVTGFEQSEMLNQVLRFNLLGGEGELYQKYQKTMTFEFVNLKPEVLERDQDNPLTFYLPYGVTLLFYIIVLTTSSLMLNSVSKEKENRVVEILMSSLIPTQLFTGKIIALGIAGLLQMVVWFGSGFIIMRLGGTTLNIPANLQLPPSLLLWSILFFLLGYGMYGGLMAGIGAIVPNLREASQASYVIIIPVIIPMLMIGSTINDPNGMLATAISIFPLTAPVAMITRLSTGIIPLWQPILAAFLLLGTVILVIRSVAGLFRSQILLTGQKFNIIIFFRALLGKV